MGAPTPTAPTRGSTPHGLRHAAPRSLPRQGDPLVKQPGDDSILRPLAVLAVPIVLANAVQTSQQLINTFWVGRLGADAVAAVSVSFPVIFLLVSLGGRSYPSLIKV